MSLEVLFLVFIKSNIFNKNWKCEKKKVKNYFIMTINHIGFGCWNDGTLPPSQKPLQLLALSPSWSITFVILKIIYCCRFHCLNIILCKEYIFFYMFSRIIFKPILLKLWHAATRNTPGIHRKSFSFFFKW